ncbi:hypothetical protein Tco_0822296 [Tanacetum coccineum]|uniref:Reverse transcriptase domain-containing protein n=1 Tax=Tanacetum coccineum TaxID=301880 RepID=A0ABQ5AHB3_9ASTR
MDAMIVKMDAQYKELQSRAKQLTPDLDDDDMPMSREEEAKFMKTFHKTRFYNDYRDQDSNRDNWRSSGRNDYNQDNYRSNTDDEPYDLQKTIQRFHEISTINKLFVKDTFMDLKTQLETLVYEHVNVIFTRSGKSYNPPDNPDDQQNNSKNPINFDSDDEDDEPTPQQKTQPIKPVKETLLPKPYKPKIAFSELIETKLNLLELENWNDMIFNIDSAMKHSYSNDDTCFSIDVIGEIFEEDFDALLDEGSKILHSIKGTLLKEEIFSKFG